MTPRADVAVVGAGPGGSAFALHAARAGLAVVLLDRGTGSAVPRGQTLAPSVRPLLHDLRAWDDVRPRALECWETRSLWGSSTPHVQQHLMSAYGCAWHVDRRDLDAVLRTRARDEGARLVTGAHVRRCCWEAGRWRVDLHGDDRVDAAVVVDATGRGAHVARTLGATRVAVDRLVALAATVERRADDGHLLVESAPEGWWYSAPLPSGGYQVVLLSDADRSRDLRLGDPAAWRAAMPGATRDRLAGAPGAHVVAHAAASRRVVHDDALPWIAVGDAAVAVDPATGPGLARTLRGAAAAADAVRTHLADPARGALRAYEDACDRDFTRHLEERAEVYAAETRWSAPFWLRRHAVPALAVPGPS